MNALRPVALVAIVGLLAGGQLPASAGQYPRPSAFGIQPVAPDDATNGAAYCKSTGGKVEYRTPVYGTNDPPAEQLVLSGHAVFCQYTAKDTSRIHVLASTLFATLPTLAALAYYAKVKESSTCGSSGANPASCYCTQLGGSDQFGGTNSAGGAWVLKGSIDEDLEACIFPDLSSIDSWGLFYHSAGIVRGINLAKVLRYKPKG